MYASLCVVAWSLLALRDGKNPIIVLDRVPLDVARCRRVAVFRESVTQLLSSGQIGKRSPQGWVCRVGSQVWLAITPLTICTPMAWSIQRRTESAPMQLNKLQETAT